MSATISESAKCPFCLVSVFYNSSSLLNHLTSCVVELYTKDPTSFACSMCSAPLPSLLPALAHVQSCGSDYCAYFFKQLKIKSSPTDTPPNVVSLSHPISHPFHLPIKDPFPPDEQENSRRGAFTALFIERHSSYCDHDPTTPRLMTTTWDFIYHRSMQKVPSGSNHDGFRRGKHYTAQRHVIRRLELLNLPYDDASVAQIVEMDNMLHLDFLRVGKQYFNKFVFDHFQQVLLRYSQYDQQQPCPTGRFKVRGNHFNIYDSRAMASVELMRHDNPVFYQLLYQSYRCVRYALKSEHQAKIFCEWLCKGRNITITERPLTDGPHLKNWARREVSDSIDQSFNTCFSRLSKKFVSQHSLKYPPCLKSQTSILTPTVSVVDHLSSNSSFSTTNESVEDADASFSLGITHDNAHLATCGMGPVTSTANQFPPISNIKQEGYNNMQAYPPIYSHPRTSQTLPSTSKKNISITPTAPPNIGTVLDTQILVNLSSGMSSRSPGITNSTLSTDELTGASCPPTVLNPSSTTVYLDSSSNSYSPDNTSPLPAANQAVSTTTQPPLNSQSEASSSNINTSQKSPTSPSGTVAKKTILCLGDPKELGSPLSDVSVLFSSIAESNNLSIAVKAVAAKKLALLQAKKKKNGDEPTTSVNDNHPIAVSDSTATDAHAISNKQTSELPCTTKPCLVNENLIPKGPSLEPTNLGVDNTAGSVLNSITTILPSSSNRSQPNLIIVSSNTVSNKLMQSPLRNKLQSGGSSPNQLTGSKLMKRPPKSNKLQSTGSSLTKLATKNTKTISRFNKPTTLTKNKNTRSSPARLIGSTSGVAKQSTKKRSGNIASNGLCPIHVQDTSTLLEVHQPMHLSYLYDLSLCGGYDKLVDGLNSSCSRVTNTTSNIIFVCKKCDLLPPGDSTRFFFCNHCHGQYHSKNMANCQPPTRTRRSYDRNL